MKRVFQLLGRFGTAVVVIAGLIQLYDWISRASPDVTVSVSEHPIKYPVSFHDYFQFISDTERVLEAVSLRSANKADENANKTSLIDREYWTELGVRNVVKELQKRMPNGIPSQSEYSVYKILVAIEIVNEGTDKAKASVLQLPSFSHVEVRHTSGRHYEVPADSRSRVELGDLLSGDSVSIMAWSDGSTSYGVKKLADIALHHDGGSVKADVYGMVSPFWVWLSSAWSLLILGPLVLYFIVKISVWDASEEIRRGKELRQLREQVAAMQAQSTAASDESADKLSQ